MWIAEGGDQIEAADLGRVAPEFGGEQVDRSFDRGRRLGATGAAEGDDRRRVGDDRAGATLDVGDVVHPRRHRTGHERSEHHPDLRRGAGILDDVEPVVRDPAVPVPADGHVVDLRTTVAEAHHRFAAGLRPGHRPPELLRQPTEEQLLRVGRDLGAEPAADVRGDDSHRGGIEAVHLGDQVAGTLSVLRRHPDVQAAVDPRRRGGPRLQRARRHPLIDEMARHDDLAAGKEVAVAQSRHAHRRAVEDDVAAGGFEQQRFAGQRRERVDVGVEDVVVDDDGVGGVRRGGDVGGDDDGDRFSDVANSVGSQQGSGDGGVEARRHRLQPEVGSRRTRRSRRAWSAPRRCRSR